MVTETEGEWQPTRWWRVVGPSGDLWCETSSESEARSMMRQNDTLEHLYNRVTVESEWRSE